MGQSNRLKLAVTIVIILVIVGTGAYLIITTQRRILLTPSSSEQAAIPRNRRISQSTTTDTGKWLRYTSPSLSFQYPPEWTIKEIEAGHAILYTPDLLEPPKGAPMSVYIYRGKSFEQLVSELTAIVQNGQTADIQTVFFTGVEISGTKVIPLIGKTSIYLSVLKYESAPIVVEYAEFSDAVSYRDVYREIVNSVRVPPENLE